MRTMGGSNKGLGGAPLRDDPDSTINPLGIETNMPQNRKNLGRVFGEEFLAEATSKEKQLAPILKLIQDRNWSKLKDVSPCIHSLKRDLSVTPS